MAVEGDGFEYGPINSAGEDCQNCQREAISDVCGMGDV